MIPTSRTALLNMTDISLEKYGAGLIPTAFVTGEGYRMIFRMLKHGPVQVELEMTNSFGQKPMDVYNTVAEIRGSEKPDEVVIVGGHLDSWDLGTGSTDNGTGSIAVLEAARSARQTRSEAETHHPLRALHRRRARACTVRRNT